MTQRLHRIVAIRAIQGARGAMHFKNILRPNIHFTAGTKRDGTQACTIRHLNASQPAGPNAFSGHMLIHCPHSMQTGPSALWTFVWALPDLQAGCPVTTPLNISRGPNFGERRTVLLPRDPRPPAAATCFNRTTPCTLPSVILIGMYNGTGRAGICSASMQAASLTAVLLRVSAIRSIPRVFSFCSIRYTVAGTSFPKTITKRAPGKNCITNDLSLSERVSILTSEKTSTPCSWKNDARSTSVTPLT